MYEVHVAFQDGSAPFYNDYGSRQEYNEGMRKLQEQYELVVDRYADSPDGKGSRLIFIKAYKKTGNKTIKREEVAKSRARYYSRTDGRTREGRGKRSGTEG